MTLQIKRVLTVAGLLASLCAAIAYVQNARTKAELDGRLIESIKWEDYAGAVAALESGADANSVDRVWDADFSIRDALLSLFAPRSRRQQKVVHITALLAVLDPNVKRFPTTRSRLIVDLLARGADPSVRDWYGQSPIIYAAMLHQVKPIDALVSYGADVDACSTGKVTPLMVAAMYGDYLMVEKLIRLHANPLLRSLDGRSALDYALIQRTRDSRVEQALREYASQVANIGRSGSQSLTDAAIPRRK